MITAKILADSVNPSGSRLTSFLLTYPRFIHSEFMTHRVFSRNAASSRAIPFGKMVEAICKEAAMPERWPLEQKGMQGGESLDDQGIRFCREEWEELMEDAIYAAEECHETGLHKSLCNRLLEPWAHITVLATATDKGLSNFFALRAHPAAQPEFQVLAYRMLELYLKSNPINIPWGRWHIPRFGHFSHADYGIADDDGIKIATARCARLSYLTFDGEHSPEKDIELYGRLLESKHLSPFEHCAKAQMHTKLPMRDYSNFDSDGQWSGWLQLRKTVEGENQTNVDLHSIMSTKPEWITL